MTNPLTFQLIPFEQEDATPDYSLIFHFETIEDLQDFADVSDLTLTTKQDKLKELRASMQSVWFPNLQKGERGGSGKNIWIDDAE